MREDRSEIIHDALDYLDDDLIEEVDDLRSGVMEEPQKTVHPWRKWVAVAASVCLIIVIGGVWHGGIHKVIFHSEDQFITDLESGKPQAGQDEKLEMEVEKEHTDDTDSVVDGDESINQGQTQQSVSIPAYQVNLGKEDFAESDMALFFIYEGRCYVQTCDYMSKDVIGEYVCTTTGLIDEWTEKDGYVELAGSFEEDIYTVKGVNPEFMLCTVYDDGVVETFVHNNGITISRGDEILEWLGFEVGMEDYAIFCNKGNSCTNAVSEEAREVLDKFFANFAENEVVLRRDISISVDEDDIYHLVIVTEEGVPLHFELLDGGYVSYYGLNSVCVKIDERIYKLVLDVLENR